MNKWIIEINGTAMIKLKRYNWIEILEKFQKKTNIQVNSTKVYTKKIIYELQYEGFPFFLITSTVSTNYEIWTFIITNLHLDMSQTDLNVSVASAIWRRTSIFLYNFFNPHIEKFEFYIIFALLFLPFHWFQIFIYISLCAFIVGG